MIDIRNLNLDAEPLENLSDLAKELRAAAKLVNDLARYADARRTASEFRQAGHIQTQLKSNDLWNRCTANFPPNCNGKFDRK